MFIIIYLDDVQSILSRKRIEMRSIPSLISRKSSSCSLELKNKLRWRSKAFAAATLAKAKPNLNKKKNLISFHL